MGRDSSRTHIHLHASRHADLFEDFTTPLHLLYSTHSNNIISHLSPWANTSTIIPYNTTSSPRPTNPNANQYHQHHLFDPAIHVPLAPGNTPHLPPEDVYVPQQYMPINPEEEDDVVPDQTAAFGITRAMESGGRGGQARERGWRDVDSLGELLRGAGLGEGVDVRVDGRGGIGGRRHNDAASVLGLGGLDRRGGTPLR